MWDKNSGKSKKNHSKSDGRDIAAVIAEEAEAGGERIARKGAEYEEVLKNKAREVISERKSGAADELSQAAEALRETGQSLRRKDNGAMAVVLEAAAGQVENLSGYLENRDLDQLIHDVKTLVRRQPSLAIGGAFASGIILARFLKASDPQVGVEQPPVRRPPRPRRRHPVEPVPTHEPLDKTEPPVE